MQKESKPSFINKGMEPLKALIFDLLYNQYRGVIVYVRIFEGELRPRQKIKLLSNQKIYQVEKVGVKTPQEVEKNCLITGEIGWFTANIRDIRDTQVGDTIADINAENLVPLPGYQRLKPNIYSNLYPHDSSEFNEFKKALLELQLQDSSLTLENVESNILGPGYCCGFLGLLHREIIQERIKKEYNLELILTAPTVSYQLILRNGETVKATNPQKMPEWNKVKEIQELFINLIIITPHEYLGNIMELCQSKRGIYQNTQLKTDIWWQITYELPFAEFITDFTDQLKSLSRGFASFDYQFIGFRPSEITKVDILLNKQLIPDLSFLVHRQFVEERSRELCFRLKETLNPQNFAVPIQACLGQKVIARETLPALRKHVTGNLYGGDRTRKMKLWQKQKKGKKKMQSLGKVEFTGNLFRSLLRNKKK
ncbi:Elongation factor 4 [endosymbiont GvMRE of Glomus versiforme]|nr:Elongation factor 4 [endosymbiont GvMRE of Glomus versiforme]